MTGQLAINENGEIVAQPMTWDNEPVYSPSTVREGLFDAEAFEQMPGQMALEAEEAQR